MKPPETPLAVYHAAVLDNPRKPGELPSAYISRISSIVAGTEQGAFPVQPWPAGRLPYPDDSEDRTGQGA